jgi:hypothetical protein
MIMSSFKVSLQAIAREESIAAKHSCLLMVVTTQWDAIFWTTTTLSGIVIALGPHSAGKDLMILSRLSTDFAKDMRSFIVFLIPLCFLAQHFVYPEFFF